MKQNRDIQKVIGWLLFIVAVGFFCMQLGYLFVHERFEVEYFDNRLFYIINIIFIVCLFPAILLLVRLAKRYKITVASIVVVFIIAHVVLLVGSSKDMNHVTSVSPDFKHVLSIKENVDSGEAIYYRTYYGILARPKERLSGIAAGDFKVKWLVDDVAAVTYQTADGIQQFIGTYGDRGSGRSYYYVGAEIHGKWQGENIEVVSNTEGITVKKGNKAETFSWANVEQFGTLAIVLKKTTEAAWTISLNENFEVHSDASKPTVGTISLYKATMNKNEPITLRYVAPN